MRPNVVAAVFKRNFVSYFSSPIGYVFICAMVLLSAFAAFWPHEFFNANLANLHQLNERLPWILLVFVPAVTMSVWALERERGTDELLLTLPARDFDVVLGKYLAALAIFTVALIFSMSNIVVLMGLGRPDLGLLAANYVGYWFVGAAMLAVGMVASFLTGNLTVAFVLAVAFNAPLVFAAHADVIMSSGPARLVAQFSIAEQFSDFARGVISLAKVAYFAAIALVMLYLSMVLIRRRHWKGRRASMPMGVHYGLRTLCLAAAAVGVTALAARFDPRVDASSEKLSSLSPKTVELLRSLDSERPVHIDAYVSPDVPEEYVQVRLDLLNKLREMDSLGGDRVLVTVHRTEHFSETAVEAEELYGISARSVQSIAGGKFTREEIVLGAAFRCGLDKVVVPFFGRGIPVEYELVRSIATVSDQQRKRIGVVNTDARLYGGFDMQTMARQPAQRIIEELDKQYETEQVNAAQPIGDDYDALLVVQPSTLPQNQLDNLIDAVKRGVPAAIFEDPFPVRDPRVAATSQPRVPPGGNNPFMNRQPPEPKGDVTNLWDVLEVDFSASQIVWEDFNPYPKLPDLSRTPELVFVAEGSGAGEPFNESDPVTSGLQQVLLMFPGYLRPRPDADLAFEPLLRTGRQTGVVAYDEMVQRTIFGPGGLNPDRRHRLTQQQYTLAARISGTAPAGETGADEGDDGAAPPPQTPINVILAADIDMLYSVFFALREQGTGPEQDLRLDFDNVTFVLNALDSLAGDERFIDIRKRQPRHRTLTAVEQSTRGIVQAANEQTERFQEEFERKRAEQQQKFDREIERLQQREGVDMQQMALEVQAAVTANEQRMAAIVERLERERDREIQKTERDLALAIRRIQDRYKFAAVLLPPVPPLILAVVVYARRRRLERVGVPARRFRSAAAPQPAT